MPSVQECINSKTISWFSSNIVWDISYFDFWTNLQECNIWTDNQKNTVIDNITYYMQWEILEKETDYIKWWLTISADAVWEVDTIYYQKN